MSERYTADDARAQFHRLRVAFGKRHTDDYRWGDPLRVGAWSLDSAPGYGGFVIEEQMNDGGGIDHPFTHERRNAREFVAWAFAGFEIMRAIERTTGRDPLKRDATWAQDTCPHVPHLHIDESRDSGDPARYVRHAHRRDGLLAGDTAPGTTEHEHAAYRAAGRLVS